ncbi:hypothetical protein [Corynebacterium ulceribovis]|uniref:hypothetical protein n=1 Tax=Corynebacterium ulceribovis TaxID=487732 RepID=UPI0003A4914C|nr:hypothetical protein [Corynebacterium ulceribovis]
MSTPRPRSALKSVAALSFVSVFALAGCSGAEEPADGELGADGTVTVTETSEKEQPRKKRDRFFGDDDAEPGATSSAKGACSDGALAAYKKVLAAPQDFTPASVNSHDLPANSRRYEYAMADTNGDGCPEMLLVKRFWEFSPVVVVSANGDTPIATKGYIVDGAGTGGSRSFVFSANDGNGVYELTGQSVGPNWKLKHYAVAGTKITGDGEESLPMNARPDHATEVNWTRTSDASALNAVKGGGTTGGTGSGAGNGGSGGANGADARGADSAANLGPNQHQVTGTVKVYTGQQWADKKLKGRLPNPSDSPSEKFAIVELDGPTTVHARKNGPGGIQSDTQSFVFLPKEYGDMTGGQYAQHDGKRVAVIYDADKTYFRSDAAMPVDAFPAHVVSVKVL